MVKMNTETISTGQSFEFIHEISDVRGSIKYNI